MYPIVTKILAVSFLLFCVLLCTLTLFPGLVNYDNSAYDAYASEVSSSGNNDGEDDNNNGGEDDNNNGGEDDNNNDGEDDNNNDDDNFDDTPYGAKRNPSQPVLNDAKLNLELISEGLQLPTQMAFIGPDDILVLEKDNGTVRRIVNGTILEEPMLDVNVATAFERGLLGIAIAENDNETLQRNSNVIYIYYTESEQDGNDVCSGSTSCSEENGPLGNRLYRYELVDNKLVNPILLLDLPASPGSSHNGGPMLIGPDNNIYLPIGEVSYQSGQISNKDDGPLPDGRGGILRITQDGEAVRPGILGDQHPIDMYYAYGIRNSFGLTFDPVTGKLWDTENGPGYGDEINLIEPGFNSGWSRVQGIWEREDYYGGPIAPVEPDDLVDFDGKGKYSTPEFTWELPAGVTSIKFLDSDKLGKDYQNDMFVGDMNNGNLYHFDLSEDRNQLLLDGSLRDRIAGNQDELQQAILAHGFNGITDIEVGPDGYLYVLSYAGEIFRISRKG
jgi:aldose sugar dehydrogenase